MKEYFRKPYMTQGITKHSDYMKAIPQKAIDVQGQISPNIEFKKPYDYQPNTAQMIHYYANNLHYLGGDPVPPLNDPSLLPHNPVLEVPLEGKKLTAFTAANSDTFWWTSTGSYGTPSTFFGSTLTAAHNSSIRFPNINISSGAKIESAILYLTALSNSGHSTATISVYLNNVDNAVAPTTDTQGNALVKTTGSRTYALGVWVQNVIYSVDVTLMVQEVVNRIGFSSGNAIMAIFRDASLPWGAAQFWEAYGHGATKKPYIVIKYSE